MPTYKEIAELIPANYRKEIVETDVINNAVATTTDKSMNYLAVVWRAYVDPDLNVGCNVCMQALLKNWSSIQPEIIELVKNENLLNAL